MTTDSILPDKLKKMQLIALPLGGALALAAAGLAMSSPAYLQSYLVGFLYALGAALGGLLLLCPIHLAGGPWSMNVRRISEAAAGAIPYIAIFFLPIALNMDHLYPWLHTDKLDHHVAHIVESKAAWLNKNGFLIRAAVYFTFWITCSFLFRSWSRKQDETGDPALRARMRWLAGPCALFHFLMMTGAAVDWVMSIEPLWFSSIFGVMFVIGQVLTMLGFFLLFLPWLANFMPIRATLTEHRLHNIGKLQFAFIVFWTYVELSQFVITYAANLPEEITWYLNRAGAPDHESPYRLLTFMLVFSQFVIPFLVLLNRQWKRTRSIIPWIAGCLLIVRIVDLYWIISPSIHDPVANLYVDHAGHKVITAAAGPMFAWHDVVFPLGFGIYFFGLFLMNFRKLPVLPAKDPMFSEQLEHEIKASA